MQAGPHLKDSKHQVLIVGAGPTGLMLAGELALAQVDVALVERRTGQELGSSRAGGLHARSLEILEQRGLATRFIEQGQTMQIAGFAMIPLDISDFPTRHNYGLALWQEPIERTLAAWVQELRVPIYRGVAAKDCTQHEGGVSLELADGRNLRADYLVGCDGGRSLIRKKAGIDFAGWDASISYLLAEARMKEEAAWGVRKGAKGINALGKLDEGQRVRIVLIENEVRHAEEPSLPELSQALIAVYGTDFGVHSPSYISRFTDAARQAASYRQGRILIAGDAAHVHSPTGGQGLNTGIQDAMNLGWKLAQVVKGISTPELLDSYQAERHPVGARVLQNSLAQTALMRGDARSEALHKAFAELLRGDEARRRYAGMMSGLDIHYDLGAGHPLLGRRMPDRELQLGQDRSQLYQLLHAAQPLLLSFEGSEPQLGPWADRVRLVRARSEGPWELPVIGPVPPPHAALIRPDGHVAWVGTGSEQGLPEALARWCGSRREGPPLQPSPKD